MNTSRRGKLFDWKQYQTGIIHRHCHKMKSRILSEIMQNIMAYAAIRYRNGATKTREDDRK